MRPWAAGCFLALLAGCASVPPPAPEVSPAAAREHDAAVLALREWRLSGRLAVQRADQGVSADLEWREDHGRFDLRVAAPLGGGTFALRGDARQVTLITAEGERYTAPRAEDLMQAHLGWTLPVSGARYWVRGVPAPDAEVGQAYRDSAGRWTDFAQDGWRISILDYMPATRPSLPRKLFLSHDELELRVVIKVWE